MNSRAGAWFGTGPARYIRVMKLLSISPRRVQAAILLLVGLGLASCSTTQGSSYSSSVSNEASAAQAAKKASPPPSPSHSGSSGSSGGSHSSPGPSHYSPSPSSQGSSIFFDLLVAAARYATSGTVIVPSVPAGIVLTIDGSVYAPGSILLPEGSHHVELRGFGYRPWSSTIQVVMGQTQSLSFDLAKAPFALDSVEASPSIFDPTAPGRLGRVLVGFKVSGPGRARVEILDKDGRKVFESEEVALTSPDSRIFWEGTARRGRSLEAGDYRVRVRAEGEDGASLEAETSITLAETRASTTASSLAGFSSGALYAPDARTLPSGHLELAMGGYAVLDPEVSGAARLPLYAGLRLGLPFKTELSASVLNVGYSGYSFGDEANWATGTASLKTQVAGDDIVALSFLLGGTWGGYYSSGAPPSWDGPARFPGYSAGLVLEYDSSLIRLFASIQGEASSYFPGWTAADIDSGAVPGFYAWAYLRAGLDLLLPDFLGSEADLALSVASRTKPFDSSLALTTPLSIGAELHWYLPGSSTVLTVLASGEWAGKTDWYLGGGLGLGFLF